MADGCRVSPEYIELDSFRENENQTPLWLYDVPLIPWNEPPKENTPSHCPPWVLAFMLPVMFGKPASRYWPTLAGFAGRAWHSGRFRRQSNNGGHQLVVSRHSGHSQINPGSTGVFRARTVRLFFADSLYSGDGAPRFFKRANVLTA